MKLGGGHAGILIQYGQCSCEMQGFKKPTESCPVCADPKLSVQGGRSGESLRRSKCDQITFYETFKELTKKLLCMLENTKTWSLDVGLRKEAEGETVRDEERGSCQASYTSSLQLGDGRFCTLSHPAVTFYIAAQTKVFLSPRSL